MTPEQIALVQASLVDLADRHDELASAFYARLFDLDPSTRALFPDDLTAQRTKFAATLTEIVGSIPRFDEFVERTMALGADHAGYGVAVAHYGITREALLGALAETLGDSFTPALAESWSLAFNLLAETMMRGAAGAPVGRT